MRTTSLSIEPIGRRWAIKHNDGFLGFVRSEAEAWRLVEALRRADEPCGAVEAPVQASAPAAALTVSAA